MMREYANYVVPPAKWLGTLPAHWGIQKIGALFQERKVKVSDKDHAPLSVAKIGIVPQLDTAVKTDAGDNRKLVCTGDFVINSRSDRKGSCGVSKLGGSVSLINIVLTPRRELNSDFIHYLMRSHAFSEEYYRNGRGIVADLWTTRYSEMKSILVPVPPRDEQDQIVRFLKWKISSINRLILSYKKEIKLIEELKTSVIKKAVTNGVSGTNNFVNTRIPWNKTMPSHWKCEKAKKFFINPKVTNKDNGEKNILSLTLNGVIRNSATNPIGLSPADYSTYQIFESNELVFKLIDLENISTSRVGIVWERGIMSSAYIRLKPRVNLNLKYFYYQYFDWYKRNIFNGLGAGVRQTLSAGDLVNYPVLYPPCNEQDQIVSYLDEKVSMIDCTIANKRKQIKTLQDLKNILIADVIMGQIDVRDIEIPEHECVEDESEDNPDINFDEKATGEQED